MKHGAGTTFAVLGLTLLLSSFSSAQTLRLKLAGASAGALPMGISDTPVESRYFAREDKPGVSKAVLLGAWRNVYPGIDLVCYGDDYQLEYIFILAAGADSSLIGLNFTDLPSMTLSHTDNVVVRVPGGEVIQSRPVIVTKTADSEQKSSGGYNIGENRVIGINTGDAFQEKLERLNGVQMNLVPAAGETGGPSYDFYASKTETSNDQFLRFLNDVEANLNGPKGEHLIFDDKGNVWFNQAMQAGRHEILSIANSAFVYNDDKPVGERYTYKDIKSSESLTNQPVSGVSWFGAVKYCNWLTIVSGRGLAERCYNEGTNAVDWCPVTATNWTEKVFTDTERKMWLVYRGFRLPMLAVDVDEMGPCEYNEVYKAADWRRLTEELYGGNNDKNDPVKNPFGIVHLGDYSSQWTNYCDTAISPGTSSAATGFRVVTSHMPEETMYIHVLYSFFLEPSEAEVEGLIKEFGELEAAGEAPPVEIEEGEEVEAVEEESGGIAMDIDIPERDSDEITPDGVTYKTPPGEEEAEYEVLPGEPGGPGGPPSPDIGLLYIGSSPGTGLQILLSPSDLYGISGGLTPFTVRYDIGTLVTVTAPTTSGLNVFQYWLLNGVPYSTNPSVTFTVGQIMSLEAVYTASPILTVDSSSPDSGVPITVTAVDLNGDSDGTTVFVRYYEAGTSITLTAPAVTSENSFNRWLMNGATYIFNRVATITLTANTTMTAVYLPHNLHVRSSAPGSGVSITVSPADIYGGSSGTTPFDRYYDEGILVTLTTVPVAPGGNVFLNWELDGVNVGTGLTTTLLMDREHTVIAVYVYVPAPIPDPVISPSGI